MVSPGKHGNNFHDGEYPRRGVLGNYLIVTGYDLGNVSVCDISGSAIAPLQSGTHSLLNEINGILIEENNPVRRIRKGYGEGLLVKGDNLYALASINKEGDTRIMMKAGSSATGSGRTVRWSARTTRG